MRIVLLLATTLVAVQAVPASAWHIAGNVYCDQNDSFTIDGPDTALASYTVRITSQGNAATFTDLTDGSGFYSIGLPDDVDTYGVTLINLPAGQSIRVPGGGSYGITLDFNQDHRDGVDFLVGGCGVPSNPTTTTPTTSSSTTTLQLCPPIPFVLCEGGNINNDADIFGSIAASAPGATLRISQHAFMSNGTSAIGDRVEIGDGSSIFAVRTNELHSGANVIIRSGTFAAPSLPLEAPCCPIPTFACGDDPVIASNGDPVSLTPGVYGDLRVRNGGRVELAPGTYTFCRIKTGRSAEIVPLGAVTINVEGTVKIGAESHVESAAGQPAAQVNVAGRLIRITQGAVAQAFFAAPKAQIRVGRGATVEGGFCVGSGQTDKHITLQCP